MRTGRWVLIEDVDKAPFEIIAALLELMESGRLPQGGDGATTATQEVAHPGEQQKLLFFLVMVTPSSNSTFAPLSLALLHTWLAQILDSSGRRQQHPSMSPPLQNQTCSSGNNQVRGSMITPRCTDTQQHNEYQQSKLTWSTYHHHDRSSPSSLSSS